MWTCAQCACGHQMTTVMRQLSPSTVGAEKQTWVIIPARQAASLPEPFCWPEPLSHCFTSLYNSKGKFSLTDFLFEKTGEESILCELLCSGNNSLLIYKLKIYLEIEVCINTIFQ